MPRLPALAALLALCTLAAAQTLTPEQQADQLLNAARKASNDGAHAFAAERFREFIQKYGNHPKADDARYGLGLAYLDGPAQQLNEAIGEFTPLANKPAFPEHALALYHRGVAYRALALREVAEGLARPNEMPQRRQNALPKLAEAKRDFALAAAALEARAPKDAPAGADLPTDLEWLARARLDQAECELRANQAKEARATLETLAAAPWAARLKSVRQLWYEHGFACYLLGDREAAGRSLSRCAPFDEPATGLHARFLLGRVFQSDDQRGEAEAAFRGVITGFELARKAAGDQLARGENLEKRPYEAARLKALANGPPPDFVAASALALGTLRYEAGDYAGALARFAEFEKAEPQSPLLAEAQLRGGFCRVRLGEHAEAGKILEPLAGHPKFGDQAQFWLGRARVLAARSMDPAKPPEREQAFRNAVQTLRGAADRAVQIGGNDPASKARRGEILLSAADALDEAGFPKEAVPVFEQIANEHLLDSRLEEMVARYAAALRRAGEYARSDQVCVKFLADFPKSPQRGTVAAGYAENAYLAAVAAKAAPARAAEVPRLFDEAEKRYAELADKFPGAAAVGVARSGRALVALERGDPAVALALLEQIPEAERTGELAAVPYLVAECLIRQTPDAEGEGPLSREPIDRLGLARQHLESFLAVKPKSPESPDALAKLGYCLRRAALGGPEAEKPAGLAAARAAYERLAAEFPNDPAAQLAAFERAKTIALAGDRGTAINELRRFTQDPLVMTPHAPAAAMQLAAYLREQNQAAEAVQVLANVRNRVEGTLNGRGEAETVGLLRYHQGLGYEAARQYGEARNHYDYAAQAVGERPFGAEARLRQARVRLVEGREQVEKLLAEAARPGLNPQQVEQFRQQAQGGFNIVREAASWFDTWANTWKPHAGSGPARARMLYDGAWAYRLIATEEVRIARDRLASEEHARLVEKAKAATPAGAVPAVVPVPEIPRAAVPVQPAEAKARELYGRLIAEFPERALAAEARFELAELHAERDETDPAIKLLGEAVAAKPADAPLTPETLARLRVRLGLVHLARKEYDAALSQFNAVAADEKSPLAGLALYRAAECLVAANEPAQAVERLKRFRDQAEFQNLPGLSDRALLRLGQASALANQWDESRQSHETLVQRFPNSPWAAEARYGVGWAYQSKGEHDSAVHWYQQAIAHSSNEWAAKAHLQIGLCRLEQKRYPEAAAALLIVPYSFDFPSLTPVALVEAARALEADGQTALAERLLTRVASQAPEGEWGKVAAERLRLLKGDGK